MNTIIPPEVHTIMSLFQKEGFEIYIVGGAVRDLLMGKLVYDWDFTTNATPEEMLSFLGEDAYYTNDFGMVGLPSKEEGLRPYEITTFRTEQGYSDGRRPDQVSWGKTLHEDLERRDFTINAMAVKRADSYEPIADSSTTQTASTTALTLDGISFQLIDQFGGKQDLEDKLVRAVGNPHERFNEDGLRMIRGVRIATEVGFTIEEATLKAIQDNAFLLNRISNERIRDELFKLLKSYYADQGIMLLRNTGLLAYIIPELEKTFGVDQRSPERHHQHDVGTHLLMSLKYCKSLDPIVRLAVLLHDIGKPQTFRIREDGVTTFYNHELVSAKIAKRVAERLRLSNADSDKLWRLVRYHQFTVDERQTDSAIRRFIKNVTKEYVADMLELRVADRLGGGARETSWRLEEFKKRLIEVQKQPFTVRDLKINGNDVMKELGIPPGREIGDILNKIFDEVVKQKIVNDKEELTKRIHNVKV